MRGRGERQVAKGDVAPVQFVECQSQEIDLIPYTLPR